MLYDGKHKSLTSAPDRIYGWRDSQLSIARHYGGIKYRGHSYVIDTSDPDEPLVRKEILDAERRKAKRANAPKAVKPTTQESLI